MTDDLQDDGMPVDDGYDPAPTADDVVADLDAPISMDDGPDTAPPDAGPPPDVAPPSDVAPPDEPVAADEPAAAVAHQDPAPAPPGVDTGSDDGQAPPAPEPPADTAMSAPPPPPPGSHAPGLGESVIPAGQPGGPPAPPATSADAGQTPTDPGAVMGAGQPGTVAVSPDGADSSVATGDGAAPTDPSAVMGAGQPGTVAVSPDGADSSVATGDGAAPTDPSAVMGAGQPGGPAGTSTGSTPPEITALENALASGSTPLSAAEASGTIQPGQVFEAPPPAGSSSGVPVPPVAPGSDLPPATADVSGADPTAGQAPTDPSAVMPIGQPPAPGGTVSNDPRNNPIGQPLDEPVTTADATDDTDTTVAPQAPQADGTAADQATDDGRVVDTTTDDQVAAVADQTTDDAAVDATDGQVVDTTEDQVPAAADDPTNGYIDAAPLAGAVSGLLDRTVTTDEVVQRAIDLGLIGPDDTDIALTPEATAAVLESFGVTADVRPLNIEDLQRMIADGTQIHVDIQGHDGDDTVSAIVTDIDRTRGVLTIHAAATGETHEVAVHDVERVMRQHDDRVVVARPRSAGGDGDGSDVATRVIFTEPNKSDRDDNVLAGLLGADHGVDTTIRIPPAAVGAGVAAAAILPIVIARDMLRRTTPWGRSTDGSEAATEETPTTSAS